MTPPLITLDRRAALKARHREAILDAADALIRERGRPQFSVPELADRANVSRRTVFNHFSSLDDVIMTTCTRLLGAVVDDFRAATLETDGSGSREDLFAEITTAVRAIDLPTVVAYLSGVLDANGEGGRSRHALADVFTRATEQLSTEIAARSTAIDEFEVAILVSTVMNGLAVVSVHWIARTGGMLDASSRVVWDDLLDRLIVSLRTGYTRPQTLSFSPTTTIN